MSLRTKHHESQHRWLSRYEVLRIASSGINIHFNTVFNSLCSDEEAQGEGREVIEDSSPSSFNMVKDR